MPHQVKVEILGEGGGVNVNVESRRTDNTWSRQDTKSMIGKETGTFTILGNQRVVIESSERDDVTMNREQFAAYRKETPNDPSGLPVKDAENKDATGKTIPASDFKADPAKVGTQPNPNLAQPGGTSAPPGAKLPNAPSGAPAPSTPGGAQSGMRSSKDV